VRLSESPSPHASSAVPDSSRPPRPDGWLHVRPSSQRLTWRLFLRIMRLDEGVMTEPHSVSAVFGTTRDLPESYVPRPRQEEALTVGLAADGHVVIWGEPRQGKSALLRHRLSDRDHCVIGCAYGQQRFDVYRMLLREAGASVAVERKRRRARGIGAKVSIFTGDIRSDSETTERAFDIDISNINDVLRVVDDSGFRKPIVMDDFHYLGRSVQREILQDLKAVYEKSPLRVILVGVWADRDQLRGLHMDLGGRVDAIEVPRWTDSELDMVLAQGEHLLSLQFHPAAKAKLFVRSQQSVGLLQDIARAACIQGAQSAPGSSHEATVTEELVDRAVQQVLELSIGRLRWYVSAFANPRKRGSGKAQPYKGILHALLIASDEAIRDGISASELLTTVQRLYPLEAADLTLGALLKGLNKLGSVHRAVRASPVLGFDAVGERLHVVDPLVRLFLTSSEEESLTTYLPDQGCDIETDTTRFAREVTERYGESCALCPTTRQELLRVIRLASPPVGEATSPEFGLPLCRNHARAWTLGLFAFQPDTTKVISVDPVAINIEHDDLSHLKAQPARAALEQAWEFRAWRLRNLSDDEDGP
jgi:hypothetical protein